MTNLGVRANGEIACLLGSGQEDPGVEEAAARGEYRLIYISEQKLMGEGSWLCGRRMTWLDALKALHSAEKLLYVAIDEASCVIECAV